jgi:hypothetical protein
MNSVIVFDIFCFILLGVAFYIKWKSPIWIGMIGERLVSYRLHRRLDPNHYVILNDIMIPSSEDGSTKNTQIDHIVVSNFGIFCIETKTYSGWISGETEASQWKQTIFHYKHLFLNPLHQNFAHTKALDRLLGQRVKFPITSLVTFPIADKLFIRGPRIDNVGYIMDTLRSIHKFASAVYDDLERNEIVNAINKANITDKKIRKEHVRKIRQLKQNNRSTLVEFVAKIFS